MSAVRRIAVAVTSALAVGGSIAAATVAAATPVQPNDAHSDCVATIQLPTRIEIRRFDTTVTTSLSGCGGLEYANAELDGPSRDIAGLDWPPRSNDVTVYSDSTPGSYFTHEEEGRVYTDPDHYEDAAIIHWVDGHTVIKYGTGINPRGSRSGADVTLVAGVVRYMPDSDRFIGYSNRVVGFQERPVGSTSWTTIGYANTDAHGHAVLRHHQPAGRCYHMFYGDTGSYFGRTSSTFCL